MLFDTHAHLDMDDFDTDRDSIIEDESLSFILNPSYDLASSLRATQNASKYSKVYASVGIHPHDAKTLDSHTLEMIGHLAKKPKVVAIGEIGLDFYRDLSPRDVQQQCFEKQIHLAKSLNLPIIIHDRDAHQQVFDTLKKLSAFETGVLLHSYSASYEMAKEYVKKGAKLSISGPVTYKNATKLIEVVKNIPLEYLFIETDSPYLTPHPFRGKRNDPRKVRLVAEKIAEIKGITVDEVARITTQNAKAFFRI